MVSSVNLPVCLLIHLDLGHNCHISHLQYIHGAKGSMRSNSYEILHISTVCIGFTGKKVLVVQMLGALKSDYIVIVLSCPLITQCFKMPVLVW